MNPTFSISEIINSAWEIVKKNIWIFAGSLFVYLTFFYTLYFLLIVMLSTGQIAAQPELIGAIIACLLLLMLPLSIYFITAFITMTLKAADGEKVTLSVFLVPFRKLAHVCLGGFLLMIAVYMGLIFCIIPGIYLLIRLQFFIFYIIDKNCNAIDALSNSWNRTKGVEMELFVFDLILGLVVFLGVLCCGIGMLVTYPIAYVSMALAYRRGIIAAPSTTTPQPQGEQKIESDEF